MLKCNGKQHFVKAGYMDKITEQIFRNKKANPERLLNYGFSAVDNIFSYSTSILNNQFALTVKISDSDIQTEVLDLSTNEPYTLFLVNEASGSFVGAVRSAYQEIMLDIANRCFEDFVFKSDYAQSVINYVDQTYGDRLEFLWEKSPDCAIWRRKDNSKWYAILMTIGKNKLGLPSDEKVEILDLRYGAEQIDAIIDNARVFRGYHMNKKHWITVCLDGSVELSEIYKFIGNSYKLAK